MAGTDINQVLAENLRHYMAKRSLKQTALAQRSGVGQTTISLYLRPENRELGAKGKAPSAKRGFFAPGGDARVFPALPTCSEKISK